MGDNCLRETKCWLQIFNRKCVKGTVFGLGDWWRSTRVNWVLLKTSLNSLISPHHTKEYYIRCCPRHWRQKEHKILTSWKNGGNKDKPSFVGQEWDPSSWGEADLLKDQGLSRLHWAIRSARTRARPSQPQLSKRGVEVGTADQKSRTKQGVRSSMGK